ncbi:TPR repeat-containing thioredoxin TTL1-like [Bidens hawaiensis]|uniref:TPR repeat-containing thioredoxin TTL1-like n=1 Tax=Bidens hawaiensis TaxID=980011 RepID=UPI0040491DE0
MSNSGNPIPATLSDRLRKSLSFEPHTHTTNKPDFRELDLGSPVSPLAARPAASSSSSSSGSASGRTEKAATVSTGNNHSGELSVESSPAGGGSRRTSSVTSPVGNVLPAGNICPSGRPVKGMMAKSPKPEVLSLGTGNYGHGSIMRGGSGSKPGENVVSGALSSSNSRRLVTDPDELKRLGNERYKKGCFVEALGYYDRAIMVQPGNASLHCNRSAALMCLNRLSEAVKECEEAVRLDSGYVRAHHRLGSFLISLGHVENARKHLCYPGSQPDPNELKKLRTVEKHLNKCADLRRMRDWNGVLRESDAAIASGADACSPLFACKSEALLKLRQLDEANLNLLNVPKFEATSCSQTKFFGMLSEAYILFVRAQIDMALGRFEDATSSIEKSGQIDPRNVEVAYLLQNVRSVSRARARGNDLFKSERLTEACSAYGEGLRVDPLNPVLFCNRAACWFKLGQYEKSLEDCNQALVIHRNYTKALLRRAATFSKLDRWDESVKDYEILRRELPNNNDIAESLFHAQVALKKSRGEDVNNMKFGGEVEVVANLDQFKAAVASSGASVVLYKTLSDLQCKQIIPSFETLCSRYPSVSFLKVDLEESPEIANAENVRVVPTIKIYKKGLRVKEMVCPSPEVLESSLRHYTLNGPRLGYVNSILSFILAYFMILILIQIW